MFPTFTRDYDDRAEQYGLDPANPSGPLVLVRALTNPDALAYLKAKQKFDDVRLLSSTRISSPAYKTAEAAMDAALNRAIKSGAMRVSYGIPKLLEAKWDDGEWFAA